MLQAERCLLQITVSNVYLSIASNWGLNTKLVFTSILLTTLHCSWYFLYSSRLLLASVTLCPHCCWEWPLSSTKLKGMKSEEGSLVPYSLVFPLHFSFFGTSVLFIVPVFFLDSFHRGMITSSATAAHAKTDFAMN